MSTTPDARLLSDRFPRANAYHPDWVVAGVSGGANPLWLAEWLGESLDLRPGMRVLDLGCGRAMSSVFWRREFGVEVWAADLWFSPTENLRRAQDAGVADGVFPLRADARSLPFADEFFDAVVSIDAAMYFGTADHALNDLVRVVKPGGQVGIALAGLTHEIEGDVPDHLRPWWEPANWYLHSAAWWRRHWERTGLVEIVTADTMPDGWRVWLDWHRVVAPDNAVEIAALEADAGRHLGYARVAARRRADAKPDDPVTTVATRYTRQPLLRS